ncbi:prephenate dehydrogenase [Prauserella halophila]|uniref:Prephenate dehydrogenase n=1 Tax=Prauserella halophila TaxID=185641 RepID=A0ABN1WE47_9PSEU|nr:prephenate dehydrogenase [Prauserella halophila]MCP2237060.1 prephenate dehydrogenase [Prauserella halophila]
MRDVCVIGLGLIGGSVLRAAALAGRSSWGASDSGSDVEAAVADGFDATADVAGALARAADADALVVLAVPLTAIDDVLRAVATHAPNCLLTDVTSVKAPVRDAVARIAPDARYAGGHPMAGTAESGWKAATATLFDGATWVVCAEESAGDDEPGTDLTAWRESAALAFDAGARVIALPALAHDGTVARTSHLPHLLAAVLANVAGGGGPLAAALAAGSLRDGTRVAGTRPELVRAMTEGNRAALLPVLDEALGLLGAARGSLASTGGLAATIDAGHDALAALTEQQGAPRTPVTLDLRAPDSLDALLSLGERGGWFTSLDGDVLTGEVA